MEVVDHANFGVTLSIFVHNVHKRWQPAKGTSSFSLSRPQFHQKYALKVFLCPVLIVSTVCLKISPRTWGQYSHTSWKTVCVFGGNFLQFCQQIVHLMWRQIELHILSAEEMTNMRYSVIFKLWLRVWPCSVTRSEKNVDNSDWFSTSSPSGCNGQRYPLPVNTSHSAVRFHTDIYPPFTVYFITEMILRHIKRHWLSLWQTRKLNFLA